MLEWTGSRFQVPVGIWVICVCSAHCSPLVRVYTYLCPQAIVEDKQLSRQVLAPRPVELDTFARLMRAHSVLRRELEAEVLSPRGLTINDFETLLHLYRADDQRLRRVDLVGRLMLTPSGVTRSARRAPGGRVWSRTSPASRTRASSGRADARRGGDARMRRASHTERSAHSSAARSQTTRWCSSRSCSGSCPASAPGPAPARRRTRRRSRARRRGSRAPRRAPRA